MRAYVHFTPNFLGNFEEGGRIIVHGLTENCGATPAFGVHHFFSVGILPYPLPMGYRLPAALSKNLSNSTIFPQRSSLSYMAGERRLTPEEIAVVSEGTSRIFIWGVTKYTDAFDQPRWTEFCASIGGPALSEAVLAGKEGRTPRLTLLWENSDQHNHAN